jgi:regulator of sigma E protease
MLILTTGMTLSGYKMPSTQIGEFEEAASSYASGLELGDVVLSVDGTRVHTGYDLSYEIMNCGYEPVDVVVLREGKKILVPDVIFPTGESEGVMFGGMDFRVVALDNTVGNVLKVTLFRSTSAIKMVFDSIGGIISGRYSLKSMSGPIGVSSAVSEVATQPMAVWNILYLFALIAMNLGVMNLLPIPALDGGRLFFRFVEVLRFGKPIKPSVEARIHGMGMALLLLFTAVIALKDIFVML